MRQKIKVCFFAAETQKCWLGYEKRTWYVILLEQFQTEFVTVQFEFQIDSLPTKLNIKVTQNK